MPGEIPDPDPWIVSKDYAFIQPYPKGFKMLQLNPWDRPRGLRQWRNFAWGFDIWYGPVPVGKTIVAANLVVWALMILWT